MPQKRKLSLWQMTLLVEFAEANRDIALGRFVGPQASQTMKLAWDGISLQLNSVAEGVIKTGDQWRRYWIELKAKTKSKAADSRRHASGTGGGPSKLKPLTDLEERILVFIGPVAVEGLPGVRIPIPSTTEVPAPPNIEPDSMVSAPVPDLEIQEEWQEENIQGPASPVNEIPQPREEEEEIEVPQSVDQLAVEDVVAREDNHPRRSPATPNPRPARRSRSNRQVKRDENVPRWAYILELQHIASQQRIATALEGMVELLRGIRLDRNS